MVIVNVTIALFLCAIIIYVQVFLKVRLQMNKHGNNLNLFDQAFGQLYTISPIRENYKVLTHKFSPCFPKRQREHISFTCISNRKLVIFVLVVPCLVDDQNFQCQGGRWEMWLKNHYFYGRTHVRFRLLWDVNVISQVSCLDVMIDKFFYGTVFV